MPKVIPGEVGSSPTGKQTSASGGEVVGIDGNGRLLVLRGEEVTRYKLVVQPGGILKAVEHVDQQNKEGVDQIGGSRESKPIAARWADCDQT